MQTTDDILFSAHGPDPIPTATTEIVGTPGNALNVYWIVSHFPIGSVVSGPFPQKDSPNVLDDENYVHISWSATLGALSYDLLFTRELQLPRQPGRFLLAANLTQTEFRDTGQNLDLYDLAGIPLGAPQEEHIYFDNRDRKQPTLRFIPWPIEVSSIIFEDGTSQDTAGGGGLPAPPTQSIQFNDNGVFEGSPNLIWDGTNVGIGTQNPQVALDVAGTAWLGHSSGLPQFIVATDRIEAYNASGLLVLQVNDGGLLINPNVQTFPSALRVIGNARMGFSGQTELFVFGTGVGFGGGAIEMWTAANPSIPAFQVALNGDVGIGTNNPQGILDIVGNTSSVSMFLRGPSNVGMVINGLIPIVTFQYTGGGNNYDIFREYGNGLLTFRGDGFIFSPSTSGFFGIRNLPSVAPSPGNGQLWYDPSDSNRVKYVP